MTPRKAGYLQLATSIAFALSILLASYLMGDSQHAFTVTMLLVAVWWVPFSFLLSAGQGTSVKSELACVSHKVRSIFHRE